MNNFLGKAKIIQAAAYYPPHLGGLERVTEEVSRQLARDGYSVTVITSNISAPKSADSVISNLIIKRLWSFDFAHTAFIPTLLWQLLSIKKPAIIHLHLAQAYVPEMVWLASKIRGIPYVVHYHLDVEPSGRLGFIYILWKQWIQPTIIRGAAHVITLSPEQSNIIQGRYGKPKEQVTFINNGVGRAFLKIGEERKDIHNPLRLLFVGRLSIQKRPERLIEALSLVKNHQLTLDMVGDGEDRAKLESLTRKLGLKNIKFHGSLHGDLLLDAYRNADVFILPSDREGMSLALLEAMAAGLPIIASDVLGITELIDDVGILVKNPSPETFARAIDELASQPQELRNLSELSLKKAQNYSWEEVVRRIELIYANLKT